MTPEHFRGLALEHRGRRWSARQVGRGEDCNFFLVILAKKVVGSGESPEMRSLLSAVRATEGSAYERRRAKVDALDRWWEAGCPT